MTEILAFEADAGQVFVEVDDDEVGIERASRADDLILQASESFSSTTASIRKVAETALEAFNGSARPPDTFEVEFGLRLNAAFGAVIARTEGEGHLQIRLVWNRGE
jgi:hypothetical protein